MGLDMTADDNASTNLEEYALKPDEGNGTNTELSESRAARGPWMARFVLGVGLATYGPEGIFSCSVGLRRPGQMTASSTDVRPVDFQLVHEIRQLFDESAGEFFQDGTHSNFSRRLLRILRERGREAFQAIAEYLFSGKAKPDVASEALRWLADFNDPTTVTERWSILRNSLKDKSARVRDGAIVGFAAIDDPRASKLLLDARDSENIAELRVLIDQVVRQLERPR